MYPFVSVYHHPLLLNTHLSTPNTHAYLPLTHASLTLTGWSSSLSSTTEMVMPLSRSTSSLKKKLKLSGHH